MRVNFKFYPCKIDLFLKTSTGCVYLCSTNASKRCKDAVLAYKEAYPATQHLDIRAYFAK